MEKLKLRLSKQHNKMLKIKSEMLQIKKNVKMIKLENFSAETFGNFSSTGNPEDFQDYGSVPAFPRTFLEVFPFPRYR